MLQPTGPHLPFPLATRLSRYPSRKDKVHTIMASSSPLSAFAPPPFSLLPLPTPDPHELFAFVQRPPPLARSPTTSGVHVRGASFGSVTNISTLSNDEAGDGVYDMTTLVPASKINERQQSPASVSSLPSSCSESSITTPTSPTAVFSYSAKVADEDAVYEEGGAQCRAHPAPTSMHSVSLMNRLQRKSRSFRVLLRSPLLAPSMGLKERRNEGERSRDRIDVVIETEQTSSVSWEVVQLPMQRRSSSDAAWEMMQGNCASGKLFQDIRTSLYSATVCASQSALPTSIVSTRAQSPSPTQESHSVSLPSSLIKMHRASTISHVAKEAPSKTTRLRWLRRRGSLRNCGGHSSTEVASPSQAPERDDEELQLASRLLGLSWGCAARQVWDTECGHYPWMSKMRPDQGWWDGEQNEEEPASGCVSPMDECIFMGEEASSKRWLAFHSAYSRGNLDLSQTPPIPRGVPDYECCPDATPARIGRLNAPTPAWEAMRAMTYARLELRRLDSNMLSIVAEKVANCAAALGVQRAQLHCLQGDTVWALTGCGLELEKMSRQRSMSAHTILNRNNGMIVPDTRKDWRFQTTEDDGDSALSSYAGIPVVAANGLPIAVLSVWDSEREFVVQPHFLRRTAREIGQLFEEHYRGRWEAKVRQMAISIQKLSERFEQGETRRWSTTSALDLDPPSPCSMQNTSHQHGWSAECNPIDLEALASLGMSLSLDDVEWLHLALAEMSAHLHLESLYLAAVSLPWGTSCQENVYMLAHHNLPAEDKLNYSFHQHLFPTCLSDEETESSGRLHLVFQSDCYVFPKNAQPGSSHPQPLESEPPFETMLVLSIARRGKLGFVLGALSRSKSKVVGIEDLRYLEALRPVLCDTIDKFQHSFRSAQRDAAFKSKRRSSAHLARVDSEPAMAAHAPPHDSDLPLPTPRRPVTPLEVFLMGSLNEAGLKPRPRPNRSKSTTSTKPIQHSPSVERQEWLQI